LELYVFDAHKNEIFGQAMPPDLGSPGAHNAARMRFGPQGKLYLTEWVTNNNGQAHQTIAVLKGTKPPPRIGFLLKRNAGPILLSILLAGLISGLVARHLVRPIAQLRIATGRLSAGELEYRIAPALTARKDEFTALANDFDRMAARIGSLLRVQKQLMLDLSHELRSPLARLRVALELSRRGNASSDLFDRMERDTERMDILIGELLLLARLASPELQQPMGSFDLAELVREVVDDARLEGCATHHEVRCAGLETVLEMSGSRELIRRAVENVVRNALRHTPPGTLIDVDLSRDGDAARLTIADTGDGVPTSQTESLFRPFIRGDGAHSGGSGLGLAIARAAVEYHGGQISAKNREACKGFVVTLIFPMGSHVKRS